MKKVRKQTNVVLDNIIYVMDTVYLFLFHMLKYEILIVFFLVLVNCFFKMCFGYNDLIENMGWLIESIMVGIVMFLSVIGVQKQWDMSLDQVLLGEKSEKYRRFMKKPIYLIVAVMGAMLVYQGEIFIKHVVYWVRFSTRFYFFAVLMQELSGIYIVYFSLMKFFDMEEYHYFSQDEEDGGIKHV